MAADKPVKDDLAPPSGATAGEPTEKSSSKGDNPSDKGKGKDNGSSAKEDTSTGKHKGSEQGKDNAASGDDGTAPKDSPAELAPVAPPVAGRTVAATVTDGTARVLLPDTDTYLPLTDAASMPVGSVIDARRGTVVMQVALPGRPAETATFSGSMFALHQGKRATTLRLRGGDFGKCAPNTRTLAAASRKRRKAPVVRSLWASDHGGHFRTHGHNSVATVRGTTWLTEDRCDGTLTRVTSGAVAVYDRHTHRRVLVRAGHSYLARHP
jgi:hypothetical protein